MDRHVKISGVNIGMSKAEAWDILKDKGFTCGPNYISNPKTISFAGSLVRITFSFDESFVIRKIFILWSAKDFHPRGCLSDVDNVYNAYEKYFNEMFPIREKVHSKLMKYVDLYNHIHLCKQKAGDGDASRFECVHISITDFIDHLEYKDKDIVLYARNSYITRSEGCPTETQSNSQKKFKKVDNKNLLFFASLNTFLKIALAVLIFIVGLL